MVDRYRSGHAHTIYDELAIRVAQSIGSETTNVSGFPPWSDIESRLSERELHGKLDKSKAGRYWCRWCRQYFNAWTDTPLEYGKVKLNKWIFAAYLLMISRKGISSLQFSKELDVIQETARDMLHWFSAELRC